MISDAYDAEPRRGRRRRDRRRRTLVDANLLMWAHHRQFPHHEQARRWIADTFSDVSSVGLLWPSLLAFVRLSTHPRILQR